MAELVRNENENSNWFPDRSRINFGELFFQFIAQNKQFFGK